MYFSLSWRCHGNEKVFKYSFNYLKTLKNQCTYRIRVESSREKYNKSQLDCKHFRSHKKPRSEEIARLSDQIELPYFSRMSSVSVHFNLHYEMISETTCLIGVVLLVVMFVLLMVRTSSYRRSSRSQEDGKLCTKPVPEENGEKSCDQVRTVFIYNKH